jgi:hypothetical protein
MRSLVIASLALFACGDDEMAKLQTPAELLAALQNLPGVASVETMPTAATGYTYYVLEFRQPVDHADPSGPTFLQKVSLMHKNLDVPMVAYTSGYWDYYGDRIVELTSLLSSNQISIEHRYFDTSRPENPDWSKLTIKQMADDEHVIISSLRTLYDAAFVTAGASKGGMTAIYHRRFYPDDVDGTVPYVAPISFGAPDTRYNGFFDTVGPDACRQAVRAAATEMLANRRAALLTLAQNQAQTVGYQYTRIPIAPALESSIQSLEWSFWQYYGIGFCPDVPATSASDQTLWNFLDDISPVSDNNDERIGQFDAYYYQAYFQLGYPDTGAMYLDPYLQYGDADYLGALPTDMPMYDGGEAMQDIDAWVKSEGNRLLFVYGQWDPWTAGQFSLGDATDSLMLVQAEGTHGSHITRLAPADRDAAFGRLAAWTGVTPVDPSATRSTLDRAEPPPLREPPAIRRALLSRRRVSP